LFVFLELKIEIISAFWPKRLKTLIILKYVLILTSYPITQQLQNKTITIATTTLLL